MTSNCHDGALIELGSVALRFRKYPGIHPSFKQAVLNAVLRRSYSRVSEFWLFRDLNIRIDHGERVGIIGRNGAGKTTLLKVISGIYTPTRGRVRVVGLIAPIIELTAGMNIELSGIENILLMGSLLGLPAKTVKKKIDSIIEFAGIEDFATTPLKYYSTGMRMRLAFSIITDIHSEILLMDEIFAAGDADFIPKATARMHQLMDASHIVVFVSHNISLVKELTKRVIWLEKGRIVRDGPPSEVCDEYIAHLTAKTI